MNTTKTRYQIQVSPYSLQPGEVGKHLYTLPLSNHRSLQAAIRKIASIIRGKLSKTFRSDYNLYGVGYRLYIKDLWTGSEYSQAQALNLLGKAQ